MALLGAEAGDHDGAWLGFMIKQVTLGPVVGLVVGWFGPRGIASVLYLLMAIAAIGFAGYEQIMSVIVLTVAISVYAHGVSAVPLSRRYGASKANE